MIFSLAAPVNVLPPPLGLSENVTALETLPATRSVAAMVKEKSVGSEHSAPRINATIHSAKTSEKYRVTRDSLSDCSPVHGRCNGFDTMIPEAFSSLKLAPQCAKGTVAVVERR